MEKCQSSGQLTGNKYWSFKSKFKRSQSSTASLGSTFYLTEEVVVGNESSSRYDGVAFSDSYTSVLLVLRFSFLCTVHHKWTQIQHMQIQHLQQVNVVDPPWVPQPYHFPLDLLQLLVNKTPPMKGGTVALCDPILHLLHRPLVSIQDYIFYLWKYILWFQHIMDFVKHCFYSS